MSSLRAADLVAHPASVHRLVMTSHSRSWRWLLPVQQDGRADWKCCARCRRRPRTTTRGCGGRALQRWPEDPLQVLVASMLLLLLSRHVIWGRTSRHISRSASSAWRARACSGGFVLVCSIIGHGLRSHSGYGVDGRNDARVVTPAGPEHHRAWFAEHPCSESLEPGQIRHSPTERFRAFDCRIVRRSSRQRADACASLAQGARHWRLPAPDRSLVDAPAAALAAASRPAHRRTAQACANPRHARRSASGGLRGSRWRDVLASLCETVAALPETPPGVRDLCDRLRSSQPATRSTGRPLLAAAPTGVDAGSRNLS